jgi:DNA-nicking Smr family endonuclease
MSPRDGSRRRVLTQDERVLWAMFTRAIEPLRARSPAAEDVESKSAEMIALAQSTKPLAVRPGAPPPAAANPQPPSLAPLGRRLRQSVARGKESIDGKLDLHGLTQSEAHASLLHFLRAASAREARLVLVITGKGAGSDGGRGVLRRQVPQWLGLPEFRAFVVGFEGAHVAHGGEGALYVKIRKSKSR